MQILNEKEYNVFLLYIAKENEESRNKKERERESNKRTSSLIGCPFI